MKEFFKKNKEEPEYKVKNERSKRWLYLITAFVSGGIFVCQVALAAVLGLIFKYDFRFLSAALALLGLGAGGIAVFLFYKRISAKFGRNIVFVSFLYFLTAASPFLFTGMVEPDGTAPFVLWAIFISGSASFFFAGMLISLLFAHNKNSANKLYFFDLLGAALAGLLLILLMDAFGLFSAVYFLFFVGLGVFLFCSRYFGKTAFSKKIFLLEMVFAALMAWLIFTAPFSVDCNKKFPKKLAERSNSFSLISVYENIVTPKFYHFNMVINCSVQTTGYLTDNIENIRDAVDNYRFFPFRVGSHEKTLIVGSGAGADVSRALLADSKKIDAVEINPLIIDFAKMFPKSYGRSPYDDPRVSTVISEARSYVAKSNERYDLILIAYTKNFGRPIGTQLFVPKHIYTKEAFLGYLDKLGPEGTLAIIDHEVFTRQYIKTLMSVVAESGSDQGNKIIFLKEPGLGMGMILFNKKGFSVSEAASISENARSYNLIQIPLRELSLEQVGILTDDKPFLWQLEEENGSEKYNYPSYLLPTKEIMEDFKFIIILAIVSVMAAIAIFLLKMASKPKDIFIPTFFIGISVGIAGLEFSLVNKLTLLLGNPVYSHIIIFSTILLFGGLGSLVSFSETIKKNISVLAVVLSLIMFGYYFMLDKAINFLIPLDYGFKVLAVVAILILPGFLSGIFFPAALKKVGDRADRLLAWSWGVDTLAFVAASLVISFAVLFCGINIMLVFGGIGYLVSAVSFRYFS